MAETPTTTAATDCPECGGHQDLPHDDIAAILLALDLGDHARPISTHAVVHREILPARLGGSVASDQTRHWPLWRVTASGPLWAWALGLLLAAVGVVYVLFGLVLVVSDAF